MGELISATYAVLSVGTHSTTRCFIVVGCMYDIAPFLCTGGCIKARYHSRQSPLNRSSFLVVIDSTGMTTGSLYAWWNILPPICPQQGNCQLSEQQRTRSVLASIRSFWICVSHTHYRFFFCGQRLDPHRYYGLPWKIEIATISCVCTTSGIMWGLSSWPISHPLLHRGF